MARFILIGGLLILAFQSHSQDAEVKLEQIAKLETYLSWLKQGYTIVDKGLTVLNNIKHGDFDLHADYFNSLSLVKGPIRNDIRIAAIIQMQVEILASYKQVKTMVQNGSMFTPAERSYIIAVFSAVLMDVSTDLSLLTAVITDGALQMNDDDRIATIDQLYTGMLKKHGFQFAFRAQVQVQALQRQKSLQEINTLKTLQ